MKVSQFTLKTDVFLTTNPSDIFVGYKFTYLIFSLRGCTVLIRLTTNLTIHGYRYCKEYTI